MKNVIIGEIYKHRLGIRYRIEEILLDATGYEKTGKLSKTIIYVQLDEGKFPAGTK